MGKKKRKPTRVEVSLADLERAHLALMAFEAMGLGTCADGMGSVSLMAKARAVECAAVMDFLAAESAGEAPEPAKVKNGCYKRREAPRFAVPLSRSGCYAS